MNYRKMNYNDLEQAAKLNAEAFADYPLCEDIRKVFINEREFINFLIEVFKVYIGAYFNKNSIFIGEEDSEIKSFSILVHPYAKEVNIIDYYKAGALTLIKKLGIRKIFKLLHLVNAVHKPSKNLKKKSWFLENLSVDSNCKGQRLGTRMIQECIIPFIKKHSCNKNDVSFVTFTNDEVNRKFYTKNGFHEFDSSEIEHNGRIILNWSYKMNIMISD